MFVWFLGDLQGLKIITFTSRENVGKHKDFSKHSQTRSSLLCLTLTLLHNFPNQPLKQKLGRNIKMRINSPRLYFSFKLFYFWINWGLLHVFLWCDARIEVFHPPCLHLLEVEAGKVQINTAQSGRGMKREKSILPNCCHGNRKSIAMDK